MCGKPYRPLDHEEQEELMSRQGHRLPGAPLTDPGVRFARTGLSGSCPGCRQHSGLGGWLDFSIWLIYPICFLARDRVSELAHLLVLPGAPQVQFGPRRATLGTAKKEPKSAEEQTPEAAASHQAKRLHCSSLKASITWSRLISSRVSASRKD
jgi:hypothetical protein